MKEATPELPPGQAHSKSEYKRRVAQGDCSVMPPLPKTRNILGNMAVPEVFTADQMYAYARERDSMWQARLEEAVRAEREQCAKLCDNELRTLLAGAETAREEGEFGEAQWAEWNAQGAKACAAAIRAKE